MAFVGGSLVPVGGHNLLEPAALGRPILTGPYHGNAREILQALQDAQGVRVVHDAAELGRAVAALLADPEARRNRGAQALQVITAGRGSGARVMALLPRLPTAAAEQSAQA